jgi:hypothetical protein
MKVFIKKIKACKDCPNIEYLHFDGEGESCEYEYDNPVCSITNETDDLKTRLMPTPFMMEDRYPENAKRLKKEYMARFMARAIRDKNKIPDWCPL